MLSIKLEEPRTRPSISRSLIIHQQQKKDSLSIPTRDTRRKGSELNQRTDPSPRSKIQSHFNQLKIRLNDALSRTSSPQPSLKSHQQQSQKEIQIEVLRKSKQKDKNFVLEVSLSNDSSIESSFDDEINEEFLSAKEALAKITQAQQSSIKQSSLPYNNRLSLPFLHYQDQMKQSGTDYEDEKINLQFLKSIDQNNENKDITEFYDNGELNVNFQSQDILQFIRYEQETLELVHRLEKYSDSQLMKDEMMEQLKKYENLKESQKKIKDEKKKEILNKIATKHNLFGHKDENSNFSDRIDQLAHKFIDEGLKKLEYPNRGDDS